MRASNPKTVKILFVTRFMPFFLYLYTICVAYLLLAGITDKAAIARSLVRSQPTSVFNLLLNCSPHLARLSCPCVSGTAHFSSNSFGCFQNSALILDPSAFFLSCLGLGVCARAFALKSTSTAIYFLFWPYKLTFLGLHTGYWLLVSTLRRSISYQIIFPRRIFASIKCHLASVAREKKFPFVFHSFLPHSVSILGLLCCLRLSLFLSAICSFDLSRLYFVSSS